MPSGDTHWQFLRESIDAFFAYSDLSSLFKLTIIESEGGAPPVKIYKSMVEKADVLLAVFGKQIPPGQFDEIVEAKRLNKIVFGFFLNYQPMSGDGDKNHKILYDVGTINPIASHYDLFSTIRTQLLGFFSHSMNDIKNITPQLIENELALAFDEDSDELLYRVGDLISKVGIDDVNIYLMSIIYAMKADFKIDDLADHRIMDMAKENESAWKVLLAVSLVYVNRALLDYCIGIRSFCNNAEMLSKLFMMVEDKHSNRVFLQDGDFMAYIEDLSGETVFSCPIFEGPVDEILMDY